MTDISTEQFRNLLRLIAPLRSLNASIEEGLHMDTFRGTSKLAIKNYSSLQQSVASILSDAYVESLTLELDDDATERELISQVSLASGQLLAYLESYTGIPSGGSRGLNNINTAPQVTINASGSDEANKERIMKLVQDAMKDRKDD